MRPEELRASAEAALAGAGIPEEQWPALFRQMADSSCAFFASQFLQGPPEPPYNGRFLIGEHHEQWADLVANHKRICVLAARDHGKSPVADSLLLLADGRRVPIQTCAGQTVEVLAFDTQRLVFVPRRAHVEAASAPVACVRVVTRTGRVKRVTREHPFLTWAGWREAGTLRVGEKIALPRELAGVGRDDAHRARAWLLGLMVGDGCLTAGAAISKADVSVQHAVVATITPWDWVARVSADQQAITLSKKYAQSGDTPRNWLREHGLLGKDAYAKRVPGAIFTADDVTIAEFVSGLVDSDCHISSHGGGSVEFYSVSEDLLRDEQHLLTRLGVLSVLSRKRGRYKGDEHRSWRLTIRGADVLRLAAHVRPRSDARREALRLLVELQEKKGPKTGKAIDLFPREAWDLVEHGPHWFAQRGLPRPNKQYAPTREKLMLIAAAEDNARLLAAARAPIFWDEIVAIEDIGEAPVYPVHVPGLENYVCDDVIDHNSFFFNLAYPLWMAEKHPGREGFIFSRSQPQAEEILQKIADEVDSNPNLEHLRPDSKARNWSSKKIRLANGHTIFARGYGTKVRGAHPVWIVVDDGLNDEDAYSELVRNKNIEYFYSAISNMIVPSGQIIVVGTPFAARDLYGDLAANERYVFRRFPAWDAETNAALWPERYNKASLELKRREIGAIRFQREFLCQPVGDESSLFPLEFFQGNPVEVYTAKLGLPWQWWENLGVTQRFMGVDFAMSTNVGADFTVIWVMGMDKAGNRWVIDIIREKGLGFQQQLSRINSAARKYNPQLIFVESNQLQRIFGDELIRTTDLPIRQCHTGENKHSLEKGIPSLRVLMETRKLRIPRGDQYSIEMTDVWISEMRNHTFVNGKVQTVGEHDDTCMAFYICEQAIRAGTFGFSFSEEEGDDAAYKEVMAGLPVPGVEYEDDDEFYDEVELDPNFVLGEEVRMGRPRIKGANLVEGESVGAEDVPMRKEALLEARRRAWKRRRGDGVDATPGRPPPGEEYEAVKPKLGAPPASAFIRGLGGRFGF